MVAPVSRRATRQRAGVLAAAVLALTIWTPSTSHAQFGKILKKAADKVAPKPSAGVVGPPPTYDQTLVQLTPDQVDRVIKGLTAMRGVLVGGNGSPGVTALLERRKTMDQRVQAIEKEHDKDMNALNDAANRWQQCHDDAVQASNEQHEKQLQGQMMSDPAFRQRIFQATQNLAVAQQKGDTAAVRKLQVQLQQAAYPYAKADTAAADAKCGKASPEPAWHAEHEKLLTEERDVTDTIRTLQDRARTAATQSSGMTSVQFAMARERIEMYLSNVEIGSPQRGFSQVEIDALNERRQQIKQIDDDVSVAMISA